MRRVLIDILVVILSPVVLVLMLILTPLMLLLDQDEQKRWP